MDEKGRTAVSKFLSFVLRHRPQAIGITLDAGGWVEVDDLLRACHENGRLLSREEIEEVVDTSPKRRFALSEDGRRIRANQGHSIRVDLGYQPVQPPDELFHGTVRRFLPSIRNHGLLRKSRHHVHLSQDEATAQSVGSRRGEPLVLRIDARAMQQAGYDFFRTPNGVWLTDAVPSSFILNLDEA